MPFKDRKRWHEWIAQRRRDHKTRAVELRGGQCARCPYSGPALGWHHRDPAQKENGFSSKTWSWERYWREIQKCDLLCANCHIEVHTASQAESGTAADS